MVKPIRYLRAVGRSQNRIALRQTRANNVAMRPASRNPCLPDPKTAAPRARCSGLCRNRGESVAGDDHGWNRSALDPVVHHRAFVMADVDPVESRASKERVPASAAVEAWRRAVRRTEPDRFHVAKFRVCDILWTTDPAEEGAVGQPPHGSPVAALEAFTSCRARQIGNWTSIAFFHEISPMPRTCPRFTDRQKSSISA